MTDNMRIWDSVSKTDPKHTKQFKRAGGFQGTAIKPIWLTKRLTEQFGPAGTGWGMEQPTFQVVTAPGPEEILVFCTVALWYLDGEKRGTVYGVGGDKVQGKNKYGPFANDEAFKASYTDALSNAMKQIGMGADIHMGLFEDEKYVRETTREFANEAAGTHAPGTAGSAGGGGDFRPAGPRQSSANGRDMAAQEPQLIANRPKGTLPGKAAARPATSTTAEQRAAKLKAATDKRVNALKSVSGWTRPTLDQFWNDNKTWIDWMADPVNEALDEYERFTAAFADAEVNMREVA